VDQLVPLVTVSDDLQTGQVMVRLFAKNLLDTDQQATLNVELAESAVKASTPVVLRPGLHAVEARLTLSSPKLWWPINHGDQPLYTVKTTLTIAGKTLAAPQKRIGFRHVRINQSTHPDKGSYFIVEINGKPIFCKGANFAPRRHDLCRHRSAEISHSHRPGGAKPISTCCASGAADCTSMTTSTISAMKKGSWSGRISSMPAHAPRTPMRISSTKQNAKHPGKSAGWRTIHRWLSGAATMRMRFACGSCTG